MDGIMSVVPAQSRQRSQRIQRGAARSQRALSRYAFFAGSALKSAAAGSAASRT